MRKNENKRFSKALLALLIGSMILFTGCSAEDIAGGLGGGSDTAVTVAEVPEYSGEPVAEINGNEPEFTEDEKANEEAFEEYSKLDSLGRCGEAYANICKELMPKDERGSIGQVKPSGWHTVRYNGLVDGNYLYNRCHLIGFQLAGENANERNLTTGTRYLNVTGMLPYEDEVADYVKTTGNHVLYRVTPIFEDDNLVASGVQMEAWSVEDEGEGVCFNVYCYNVQPGIEIDYATGDSWKDGSTPANSGSNNDDDSEVKTFVVNTSSKKFHKPDCSGADDIKAENKKTYKGTAKSLLDNGYSKCKRCMPGQ